MRKVTRLAQGSTVAIVSPSWGGPATFPHVFDRGVEELRVLGLETVEYPTARMDAKALFADPKARADDINSAFADPGVDAVLASIGGEDSVRILGFLDREVILANPKLFMGFSDSTCLTTYLNQLGLISFNGPSVMAGFSQLTALGESYRRYIVDYLFNGPTGVELPHFEYYCDGYPEWGDPGNTGRTNEFRRAGPRRCIQGTQRARGRLFGGCLEVLEMMKGTDFWPAIEFWDGKVFFFETSEEAPDPEFVRFMLRNYGVQGVFDRISALVVGRPARYSDEQKKALDAVVASIVRDEFGCGQLPIVTNVDFGHTDPQVILPLGVTAEVDPATGAIRLLDSPYA